ncbi:MAG: hypothetical protein IK078_01195 [Lachnospiraceae bacterium]|nr:hypothetical protein [Lachnospiraceae bacterium]
MSIERYEAKGIKRLDHSFYRTYEPFIAYIRGCTLKVIDSRLQFSEFSIHLVTSKK